jgi:hypothetical protein
VEALEERAMRSIVFLPQFGPEHATDQGGLKLNDVPVYLIYKGTYWTGAPTPGNPSADDITGAAATVLNSGYFRLLTQYGVDGKAHLAGTYVDGSDLPANFSSDDLQNVVENAQDQGIPESDDGPEEPIYVVVTPPGVASGDKAAASYNLLMHDYDFPVDRDDIPLVWLGGLSGNGLPPDASMLDIYTDNFSHEVGEAITCNDQQGIVTPPTAAYLAKFGAQPGTPQIGDNEADLYTYRLGTGQLVQSLWSEHDQAYVVLDGNRQIFSVSAGVLTVNDDQGAVDDTIEVSTNTRGGPTVTLDGETVQFDAGQITRVVINCHTGNDRILVDDTGGAAVEVFLGSGNATVTAGGPAKSLVTLSKAITVHGGSGTSTLVVNDQGNHVNTTYSISSGAIFASNSGAPINYDHLSQVVINGGNALDVVHVDSTSAPTTFNAGGAFNIVTVARLYQNLDAIGSFFVDGGTGGANLVIDDQANPASTRLFFVSQATYTVTSNSVKRDAASGIRGFPLTHRISSIQFAHLKSLTLNTGAASNTDNLVSSSVPLTVNAGAADAITAGATLGQISKLTVDAHGGTLTLDDRGTVNTNTSFLQETHTVTFTVTDQAVTRVDQVHQQTTVLFPTRKVTTRDFNVNGTYSYANVSTLILDGGPVSTTFNIQSTAAGTSVTVNAGQDGSLFRVGNAGSVKSIRSGLTLNGGGAQTSVVLDDSTALVRDVVSVTATQVGAAAGDQFFAIGGTLTYAGVGALNLFLSNAADDQVLLTPSAATAFFVSGNSAQFQAGHGATLSLDLTAVTGAFDSLGAPGSGRWTFANRLGVTYSGMA